MAWPCCVPPDATVRPPCAAFQSSGPEVLPLPPTYHPASFFPSHTLNNCCFFPVFLKRLCQPCSSKFTQIVYDCYFQVLPLLPLRFPDRLAFPSTKKNPWSRSLVTCTLLDLLVCVPPSPPRAADACLSLGSLLSPGFPPISWLLLPASLQVSPHLSYLPTEKCSRAQSLPLPSSFQTQTVPNTSRTLASRTNPLYLPFRAKAPVLVILLNLSHTP